MRDAKVWLGMVAMVAASSAVAADAAFEAAKRCTQVRDSLERLVCYDRALNAPGAGSSAAVTAAPPAPAAMPPAPAPAPPVAAPPVAAAPAFGVEQLKRAEEERKADKGPSSMQAKVVALKETRKDVVRITLDNGQVWQQMDMESLFQVAVGDTVQIERGTLGGYRMARVGSGVGGRSGWARVNRLQ